MTLADLFMKAGNPDLTHWRIRKIYTVLEAALLTCAIEPLEYDGLHAWQLKERLKTVKPTNWQHAYLMIDALIIGICTQEIKSPQILAESNCDGEYQPEQINISFDHRNDIIAAQTLITKLELYKWLEKQGYLEPSKILNKELTSDTSHLDRQATILSIESYSTPAIKCIEAVVNEFWKDFDPQGKQSPPKQEMVIQWIAEHQPEITAAQIRLAIDKICRHPSARTGGVKPLRSIKDITL